MQKPESIPVRYSNSLLQTPTDPTNRFEFGANWAAFLSGVDRPQVERAKQSLQSILGLETLQGKSFLDVGSGSGLFSLAAHELGATVHSFDFDPQSVQCTREIKHRYARTNTTWTIERGSVLDVDFLARLGTFDVVYSWGVLHPYRISLAGL